MTALTFAALRFYADENIAERVYWYLSPFPAVAGDEVLAPVGAHDGLQRARVERTLVSDAAHAPYDCALIKRIEAPVRPCYFVRVGGTVCHEWGGMPCGKKRYTRFRRVLYARHAPAAEALSARGIARAEGDPVRAVLSAEGCLLFAEEEGTRAFSRLLLLAAGEEEKLSSFGYGGAELSALREKLC